MAVEQHLLERYLHWQHAPARIVLCEWQNTQVLPSVFIHGAYCNIRFATGHRQLDNTRQANHGVQGKV